MKKKGTVFYLDDELQILEFVKFILEKYNYNVITKENWDDSYIKLLENVDIVLLDIMFPTGHPTGYEICEKIKDNKKLKNLPIYMISAKAFEEDKNRALESGAKGFIEKPFTIEELIEILEHECRLDKKD